ncbi:hypothetical protein BBW65_05210 [Helicobacter enhydrae]|uniref:Phosphoethanolamine transferase n=1 Tax=Helicobacter enhydrae TaxID=222136 RepID=A0A1B1U612_9HELI|nr:phosphoethanolamine transferase domain-containing protein [Helicobacter enhydrae]ANV98234.1 hypothetical protein BBW65_05210 [Helicobacter enhydrae]
MLKLSYHLFIFCFALVLSLFYNTYFFDILKQSLSSEQTILASSLLTLLLAMALEILSCRWTIKWVSLLILLIASASSYIINTLHIGITTDVIQSLIYANPREFQESLTLPVFWHFCLWFGIPALVILYLPLAKSPRLLPALITKCVILLGYAGAVLLLWFGLVGTDITFAFKKDRLLYYISNPISPIRTSIQFIDQQYKSQLKYEQIALDAVLQKSQKPKFIVLIIGESARSANFAINGYSKPTTPLLSQQNQIISFRNFRSCGVITAISVPCMLTNYTHQTYTKRYLSEFRDNILDITQRVGIQTYYIGNNGGGCIGQVCIRLPKNHIKFYDRGGH